MSSAPTTRSSASRSGDPLFAHQVTTAAGSAELSLEGELDLAAEPQLELLLDRCSSAAHVIVDLRAVSFISCGVLRQLLAASRHTQTMGGRFLVVPSPGAVQRLIDLIGVERELELVATPPDHSRLPRSRRLKRYDDDARSVVHQPTGLPPLDLTAG